MIPVNIDTHFYTLRFLNSEAFRNGALLRVHYNNGLVGYCDCHVWEELGDLPIKTHLDLLKSNILTEITKPALNFAKIDALARKEKILLFQGETFPKSHFLIFDLLKFNQNDFEAVIEEGFTHFKIKMGKNLDQEMPKLKALLQHSSEVKFRIDTNERLERGMFHQILKELTPYLSKIEFWEDPYPYHPEQWSEDNNRLGVPFACDRRANYAAGKEVEAHFIIAKPAVEIGIPYAQMINKQRLVLTTYLGHPLSQSAAACATLFLRHKHPLDIDVCGFLTHRIYEKNAFSEQLSWYGSFWKSPKGAGFGFDEQLESLKWIPL